MSGTFEVYLVHWKAAEAPERIERLTQAGCTPVYLDLSRSTSLKPLREAQPDAVVIDLGRLPSHGLEIGCSIRSSKAIRHIPLVFVGGKPDKVARVRGELPDAAFCEWEGVAHAIRDAIQNPKMQPAVPVPHDKRANPTPLSKKLGIKPGMSVAIWDGPDDIDHILADLPVGAVLQREEQAPLTLYFVRSLTDLQARSSDLFDAAGRGGVWVCWPKTSQTTIATDLNGNIVRTTMLDAGLMDFKVCSVSALWSGLRFSVAR
jgi:hypothetical protein